MSNGSGSGRKSFAFEAELGSLGFDTSEATYHSGVALTDLSIIGVQAELTLPVGVALDSGVLIDLFEKVSATEVRSAGVELSYWGDETGSGQPELWYNKTYYSSGEYLGAYEETQYDVTLGQTYTVSVIRQNGLIHVYRDDTLVAEYPAEGELLGFIIVAFNEEGQPMTATVDNVKVLRTQVQ